MGARTNTLNVRLFDMLQQRARCHGSQAPRRRGGHLHVHRPHGCLALSVASTVVLLRVAQRSSGWPAN
jgi:hypothetical protein